MAAYWYMHKSSDPPGEERSLWFDIFCCQKKNHGEDNLAHLLGSFAVSARGITAFDVDTSWIVKNKHNRELLGRIGRCWWRKSVDSAKGQWISSVMGKSWVLYSLIEPATWVSIGCPL